MFKNTAKTTILLAAMGGLIVGVASLLGGGSSGAVMIGLVLALIMVGGSYWFSDKLALASAKAQVISEADHPEFYGMVRPRTTCQPPYATSCCLPQRTTKRIRHWSRPEQCGGVCNARSLAVHVTR